MAIRSTFMSFTVLLLSTIGRASALSIADIGLMVLPDQGNPSNTDTCTLQESSMLSSDLNQKIMVVEDNYSYTTTSTTDMNVRRELQDNQDLSMDTMHGHRKLVNCRWVCQGFAPGHCYIVYPSCTGYRELKEEESMEATQNLRGSERQLQTSSVATTVLANGFMSGFSVDHPQAAKLCADLKASMNVEILGIPNRMSSMSKSCRALWSKSFKIGCVYAPAL